MKDEAEAIIVTKVFRKALETVVTSEAVTVSGEVAAVANMSYYLHDRRSVIFATN
jgi:hypothetical protein